MPESQHPVHQYHLAAVVSLVTLFCLNPPTCRRARSHVYEGVFMVSFHTGYTTPNIQFAVMVSGYLGFEDAIMNW